MSRKLLTGSFVALITPFNKDGSVDFAAFRALLKFQQDNGTSAGLIMGSTGETSMLAPEEKKQITIECAKMKTPAMPIFFGCTGNNTETTIANVRFARDNGADGAILAAPAYICAPESDIVGTTSPRLGLSQHITETPGLPASTCATWPTRAVDSLCTT